MEINIQEINNVPVGSLVDESIVIESAHQAAELIMNCIYSGSDRLILHQTNLPSGFFVLKTGLAGDFLQQFSTYGGFLAIIGDFSGVKSQSLQDFISESNRIGRINFVRSMEEAISKLTQ
ncbi:MAG: DUF4180 domain-containing protein [Marinoscillum sp.]